MEAFILLSYLRCMKLKVPPVFVLLISLIIMFGAQNYYPEFSFKFEFQKTISRVILAAGAMLAFGGIFAFRANGTTVDPRHPEKASSLVKTGVYRYTRNPMYLGMASVLFGDVVRFGNPLSLLGVLFFCWFITQFQIKPEEDALEKLFGESYLSYKKKVRRWI